MNEIPPEPRNRRGTKLFKASDDADKQLRELGPAGRAGMLKTQRAGVQKEVKDIRVVAALEPAGRAGQAREELAATGRSALANTRASSISGR